MPNFLYRAELPPPPSVKNHYFKCVTTNKKYILFCLQSHSSQPTLPLYQGTIPQGYFLISSNLPIYSLSSHGRNDLTTFFTRKRNIYSWPGMLYPQTFKDKLLPLTQATDNWNTSERAFVTNPVSPSPPAPSTIDGYHHLTHTHSSG